jgi:hypothetical protein
MEYCNSLKLLQVQLTVLRILYEEVKRLSGKNIFIQLQENVISLIVPAV